MNLMKKVNIWNQLDETELIGIIFMNRILIWKHLTLVE